MKSKQNQPSHLAVARFSSLGDLVLCSGPLLAWQQDFNAEFTLITSAAYAELFDGHPAVRQVIGLRKEQLNSSGMRQAFQAIARELGEIPLLDLHGNLRSRYLCRIWQGKHYRYPKSGLSRRLFLLSKGRFGGKRLLERNVPQRYWLAMPGAEKRNLPAAERLRPSLFLTDAEKAWAREQVGNQGAQIALHPFAAHPGKAWPREHWLILASLLEQRGMGYFWIGQTPENSLKLPGLNFVNQCTIRQSAALLSVADLVVTGDSGPLHLACAVETPVLALFGPTVREWGFYPVGSRDLILEANPGGRPYSLHGRKSNPACALAKITPEQALAALERMLAARQ